MEITSTTIKIESAKLAAFLREKESDIIERLYELSNDPLNLDGSTIAVNLVDVNDMPFAMDDFEDSLFAILGLEEDDDADEFMESFDVLKDIEDIVWDRETVGLDGDDGRWNRANYDPEILEELLNKIASQYDCSPTEVTDEMFQEFVTPTMETVTDKCHFEYNSASKISVYTQDNGMTRKRKEIRYE